MENLSAHFGILRDFQRGLLYPIPMSIWILLIALVVVFGAIGFFLGGIRAAVTVGGLLLALMLARSLAPIGAKLLYPLGVKSIVEIWLLAGGSRDFTR